MMIQWLYFSLYKQLKKAKCAVGVQLSRSNDIKLIARSIVNGLVH